MADTQGKDPFGGEDIFKLLEQVQEEQNKQDKIKEGAEAGETKEPEASVTAVSLEEEKSALAEVEKVLSSISTEAKVIDPEAEILVGIKRKSIDDYDKSVYGFTQLEEIQRGLEHSVDVSFYDDAGFSFRQMREIRLGLEMGLDVTFYANKFYKDRQMREIRLGLMDNLDVQGYARLIYSTPDMQERRMKLLKEKYDKMPQALDSERFDKDTGIKIIIRDKQMKAYIKPTVPLPEDYNATKLDKLLELYNVVVGVDIEKLFEKPGMIQPGEEYQVAAGTVGKPGRDGYYEYKIEGMGDNGPSVREDGSIDYRATRRYASVKAGDTVAIYHLATMGEPGRSVTGIPVYSVRGNDITKYSVDGIRLMDDGITYIAQRDGLVTVKNGSMSVQKHLELQGDVAYGSGNVSYDGTISINGSVRDNVVIEANGDIMINGFVEGARLKAGGNVVISKGVNGNDKGSIEAGGKLTCSFLENVKVETEGDIECGYILNSSVVCKGSIKTEGRRASICGGSVAAMTGIETNTLGSNAGIRTDIRLGEKVNFGAKLSVVINKRREVEAAMNKTRSGMADVLKKLGPMQGRQHPIFLKFQDLLERQLKDIEEIQCEQAAIEEEMAEMCKRFIKVERTVYSNTYMTINGISTMFEKDEPGGRFHEDGGMIQC